MKKLILSLLVVFAAIAANAQVYLGGSLAFTHDDEASESVNTFKLAPEVGYSFNDRWSVGGELAFIHHSYEHHDNHNAFAIAPYARYNFYNKGIVSLFIEGGMGFSTHQYDDSDHSVNGFEIGLKPGIALNINDHFRFFTKYGFFGYRDDYAAAGVGTDSTSGLDLSTKSLSFGFYYVF